MSVSGDATFMRQAQSAIVSNPQAIKQTHANAMHPYDLVLCCTGFYPKPLPTGHICSAMMIGVSGTSENIRCRDHRKPTT